MTNQFRKETINIGTAQVEISSREVVDIFRFKEPPYICVGASGSGKTTLCLDLIMKYASECSNIYYMTATKEDMRDNSLSLIPKAFIREPTIENLIKIWSEIKMMNETIVIQDEKLSNLIVTAYSTNDLGSQIALDMKNRKREIYKERFDYYIKRKYSREKADGYATDDANAFFYETTATIIIDYIKNNGDSKFSTEQMELVHSFFSKQPKTLLLLDDMTSQLESMKRSKKRVSYDGKQLTEKDAIECIINEILNVGRHYNLMTAIFAHTVDVIPNKSLIVNIVILNEGAATKFLTAKTVSETTKNLVRGIKDFVFGGDYKYYFLYINQGNNDCCVGKADLHFNEEVQLDDKNKAFIQAYNNIASGININIGDFISNTLGNEDYDDDAEEDVEISAFD